MFLQEKQMHIDKECVSTPALILLSRCFHQFQNGCLKLKCFPSSPQCDKRAPKRLLFTTLTPQNTHPRQRCDKERVGPSVAVLANSIITLHWHQNFECEPQNKWIRQRRSCSIYCATICSSRVCVCVSKLVFLVLSKFGCFL